MNRREKIQTVQKTIRYLANLLLIISILFLLSSLYAHGFNDLRSTFYLQLVAIWQVVIMLILTENFYLLKK